MAHGGTIIDFPGQEANEQIYIFARRSSIAYLPRLILILAMAVLGVGILYIIGMVSNGLLTNNFIVFLASSYILFLLLYALVDFFDFYFDLYIVTDRRIVDIDQNRLFSRKVAELLLDDIEDVDSNVSGIFATFFDFGTVTIQTAGTKPNFVFEDITHPKEVAAMILDLSDQGSRGVPVAERHPEGPVAAIIDNRIIPHTPNHENEVV
jgi:hypothetical protein